MASAPIKIPFLLLSAFSSNPNSGNPAAVVFLPSTGTSYPKDQLQAISRNLNQPITCFISSLPEPPAGADRETAPADFAIRWFTVEIEIPLCGHGTLAAAKAIFAAPDMATQVNMKSSGQLDTKVDGNTASSDGLLRFQTINGSIVSARKSTLTMPKSNKTEVEQIQITFPHAPITSIIPTSPAATKIRSALAKALQKPAGDVDIKYMGHGEGSFDYYLMVELGDGEILEGRQVEKDAFRETGFEVNVMTKAASPSAAGSEVFVSRMFAPLCGVPEDHVCGSAHCLLVPYWAQKRLDSSAASGSVTLETPMKVLQVSPRGGTLFVSWDTKERVVKIGGEVAVWGRGEVFI